MRHDEANLGPDVVALCAALEEACGRIGRRADDVSCLCAQDEVSAEALDDLDALGRVALPLLLAVERAAAGGLPPGTREALASSAAKVQAAAEAASASLRRLGEQLDQGIQGSKGSRAYLTNNR